MSSDEAESHGDADNDLFGTSPEDFEEGLESVGGDVSGELEASEGAKKEAESQFRSDADRKNERKETFHKWSLICLRAVIVVALATLGVRAWHILAPESLLWLSSDQLGFIDNVLLNLMSAVAGALLTNYFSNSDLV